MTLEQMPIEDLEVLYKEMYNITMYIEYPMGTVDVDEVWELYNKIEKTLEKRKENINPDKKSLVGHCFIFHIDEGYAACKIRTIENSDTVYCDCLMYNAEEEEFKFKQNESYTDIYDDGFALFITKDNRLNVCFHDDYDGSCFAKEISIEEYQKLISAPMYEIANTFVRLGVSNIDIY